jgi:hypothetical protein
VLIRRSTWRLSLYAGLSLAMFILVAIPALNGELDLQFYADSLTYETLARQTAVNFGLISVGANLLGPLLLLKLLGHSRFLVCLFNLGCLVVAYRVLVQAFPIDGRRFLWYLTISPLVLVSMLAINKESVSLPAIAFFAAFVAHRRVRHLVLALVLALLVRWQLVLFMLVFLGLSSPLNPLRRYRLVSLVLLTLGISVMYVRNLAAFEAIDRIASLAAQENSTGSGLFSRFITVQNHYGYFLVFIPKTLHQMVGLLLRSRAPDQEFIFFNDVVMVAQSAVTAGLLVHAAILRRYRLSDDLFYIAVTFAAIFALSPIYAPRYFLPVYVLVAAMVARYLPGRRQAVPAVAPAVPQGSPPLELSPV